MQKLWRVISLALCLCLLGTATAVSYTHLRAHET